MSAAEWIAKRREIEQAATDGPWMSEWDTSDQWWTIHGQPNPAKGDDRMVCPEVATLDHREDWTADDDLIVAAVSALPALLDAADERDRLLTAADTLGRVNGEYAMEIHRCREALGVDEDTDPHHAAQALVAAVERVRALHTRGTVEMITATDCVNEDCEHEDDCPTQPVDVCLGCVNFAETATLYALEHADVQERVAWPCATIRALDGTDE